jgi:hypothetical protein
MYGDETENPITKDKLKSNYSSIITEDRASPKFEQSPL